MPFISDIKVFSERTRQPVLETDYIHESVAATGALKALWESHYNHIAKWRPIGEYLGANYTVFQTIKDGRENPATLFEMAGSRYVALFDIYELLFRFLFGLHNSTWHKRANDIAEDVNNALRRVDSPYRLANYLFVENMDDASKAAVEESMDFLSKQQGYEQALKDVESAFKHFANGAWRDSVTNSIRALEFVLRKALARPEDKGNPTMDKLVGRLKVRYGNHEALDDYLAVSIPKLFMWSNKVVRHGDATVEPEHLPDANEAKFVLTTVSALVNLIIEKEREAVKMARYSHIDADDLPF